MHMLTTRSICTRTGQTRVNRKNKNIQLVYPFKMRHQSIFISVSYSHWYFKLKEKIRAPNQHLAVAENLKALDEKLLSLLLVSLTKRGEVHKHLQKKTNQLKSKRRAALKPLMDQNKDHLRRLKSNLDSLNAYSRQQGNCLKELIRLAQVMEKVLKSTAAIVSAKDDVCL